MQTILKVRGGEIRLLGEIGHGAASTVYLGEQSGAVSRRVAVKLLRVPSGASAELVLLASLDHPNIVRLLDEGATEAGLPYLVTEYVDGPRIDEFSDAGRLSLRERVELLRKVMAGVSHAHQHLVIHADLKPSNILVAVGGEPKLLDFGVARKFGGEPLPGDTAYTPAFASPEQRRQEPVTVATDVYGLGAIMAILLTGRFAGGVERASELLPGEGLAGAAQARGTTVAGLRRAVAGDLDAILAKALEEDAEKRYPSVEAFSADLGAWLGNRPVAATAPGWGGRTQKWVLRHRVLAASGGIVSAAILMAVAGVTVQTARAEHQRRAAEVQLEELLRLTSALDGELYGSVQGLARSDEARSTLLRGATETMDKLAGDGGQNATLTAEMAKQYAQLARLQVSGASPSAAQKQEARRDVEKGLTLMKGLQESAAAGSAKTELEAVRAGLGR